MRFAAVLLLLTFPALLLPADITAFGKKWTVPIAEDWKVATIDGKETLQLLVPRPQEKPRRPKQFALLESEPYSEIDLTVDVKRNEKSLIVVYNYLDEAHFNYAHISVDDPAKVAVHEGIFHVFGGDRVRISNRQGGPGLLPDTGWRTLRLQWSASTGEVRVTVDGKTSPALRGVDLSLSQGRIGLGSFFETAQFRNFNLKAK